MTPGVGLFPDWCRVDAEGRLSPAPGRETQFGWEAVRLPWRLALDHLWFSEPRAAQILGQNFCPFSRKSGKSRGKLAAVYDFDGAPAADYESPVLYAGVLAAALAAGDRDFARLMAEKILTFYHEQRRPGLLRLAGQLLRQQLGLAGPGPVCRLGEALKKVASSQ